MTSQITTAQVSITASASALSATATNFTGGVKITNLSSSNNSVFIGISGVTATTGDELPAGQSVVLPIPIVDLSSIYAICAASGTATVSWLAIS
jgi:hypothetical protein